VWRSSEEDQQRRPEALEVPLAPTSCVTTAGPVLAVYRITTADHTQTGLLADVKVAAWEARRVKGDEHTQHANEEALLAELDLEQMEEVVTFTEDDLVDYSPITEQHVDTGMTLLEVIDASVRYSDNTAGNLTLDALGGIDGFTEDLRAIGDEVTEPARYETELNEATPGDTRDTSTPRAMATSLRAYTLGDVMPQDRREVLIDLLIRNTTGDATIRAGVPEGWIVGDKTGSADHGTRNDIGLLWPSEGDDPIVLAIMSSRGAPDAERRDELIAAAAGVVAEALH
jgi:beta-lactamase class A